jgi:hypothetical protein
MLAKAIGDDGQLFLQGMNKTPYFFDGTACSDCYSVPDLSSKESEATTPANPTAWPKIRFWQHTLNHADHYGIDLAKDLCVMMDGLDVMPVSNTSLLRGIYSHFYPDKQREGILFAGDSVCHPFCVDRQDGCWYWGEGYTYDMERGAVPGDRMCAEQAALADASAQARGEVAGPNKYICGGLFMGRCKLIHKMLNLVDDVIAKDGAKAGYFDQGGKKFPRT